MIEYVQIVGIVERSSFLGARVVRQEEHITGVATSKVVYTVVVPVVVAVQGVVKTS